MNLASCFYYRKARIRHFISHETIRPGTILKVYPAERSHVYTPYLVKVIFVNKEYFETRMLDNSGHIAKFIFDSEDWKKYHHCRFKIYGF